MKYTNPSGWRLLDPGTEEMEDVNAPAKSASGGGWNPTMGFSSTFNQIANTYGTFAAMGAYNNGTVGAINMAILKAQSGQSVQGITKVERWTDYYTKTSTGTYYDYSKLNSVRYETDISYFMNATACNDCGNIGLNTGAPRVGFNPKPAVNTLNNVSNNWGLADNFLFTPVGIAANTFIKNKNTYGTLLELGKDFAPIARSPYSKWFIPGSIIKKIGLSGEYLGPIGFGLSSFSSIASSAVLKPGDNGYQSRNTTFMDIGVGGVALKIGGWYGAIISIGYWGLKYGATHMSPTQIRQLPLPQPFIFGGH